MQCMKRPRQTWLPGLPGDGDSGHVLAVQEQLHVAAAHHHAQPRPGRRQRGDREHRQRGRPLLVQPRQVQRHLHSSRMSVRKMF